MDWPNQAQDVRRLADASEREIIEMILETVGHDPTLGERFLRQVARATVERRISPAELASKLRYIRLGRGRLVNPIRAPGNYFCIVASELLNRPEAQRRQA